MLLGQFNCECKGRFCFLENLAVDTGEYIWENLLSLMYVRIVPAVYVLLACLSKLREGAGKYLIRKELVRICGIWGQ